MPVCGIKGCSNKKGVHTDVRYFKTPAVITGQGEETKKLSEERRRLWKRAIYRKDIHSEEQWDRTLVCSRHFVNGIKAYLHDRANPSWLPTLHLPDLSRTLGTPSPKVAVQRFDRATQRKEKRQRSDAATSLLALNRRAIELPQTNEAPTYDFVASEFHEPQPEFSEEAVSISSDIEAGFSGPACKGSQTDLTTEALKQLEDDNQARVLESSEVTARNLYSFDTYDDATKAAFYTGLPNVNVIKTVFNITEEYMTDSHTKSLSKESQFLLCLVKLRMNYLFQDIANELNISVATVQRSFHDTLNVLYERLEFLIKWPEREELRMSMPMCFREKFGQKVVVVLDCFELFTERPSSQLNKVYTYSNYKHHQTVKYLIGVSPQGVVTFISQGWGGRTSDKHITEQCGLLQNILPGDCVMVDRGFNIEEAVNFHQAELAIPSFTRGKPQLHPKEVEKTRNIASVRIHVERVIGLIVRKFRIFAGIIPVEFIKLRTGEHVPTIDKIVKVACCLTNLCVSVVPFE